MPAFRALLAEGSYAVKGRMRDAVGRVTVSDGGTVTVTAARYKSSLAGQNGTRLQDDVGDEGAINVIERVINSMFGLGQRALIAQFSSSLLDASSSPGQAGRRLLASSSAYRRRVRALVVRALASSPAPVSPSSAATTLHAASRLSRHPTELLGVDFLAEGPEKVMEGIEVMSGAADVCDVSLAMEGGVENAAWAAGGLTASSIATTSGRQRMTMVASVWAALNKVADMRLRVMLSSEAGVCVEGMRVSAFLKRVPFSPTPRWWAPCGGPVSVSTAGARGEEGEFWEQGRGVAVALFDAQAASPGWRDEGVFVGEKVVGVYFEGRARTCGGPGKCVTVVHNVSFAGLDDFGIKSVRWDQPVCKSCSFQSFVWCPV